MIRMNIPFIKARFLDMDRVKRMSQPVTVGRQKNSNK